MGTEEWAERERVRFNALELKKATAAVTALLVYGAFSFR